MTTVTQVLWFEKDMQAAIRLYTSLIPGSSVQGTTALPAESPSGPADSVTITNFTIGGQRYMAFQAGTRDAFNHRFSIMVQCDDQGEVDRLWDALLDGGEPQRCGWLRDRWGLCWQIVPKRLGDLIADPDRAKAARVAEAMMAMVKIDLAALEAAARGA